ncbi:hypothetical protein KY361_06895 [Candidatus Woesearchaeota archaeon]|nr:hypothetical protein [Candidatus Woesearchaeota archaeon]
MIMKKDVNFGLFILIIATLVCFAGFTTYYQSTFENISTNYAEKIDELEKVTDDLQLQKSRLNETSYELKIKVDRETELSDRYNTVKSERDQFEQDNTNLKSELSTTKSKLSETEATLTATQSTLAQTASDLENAEDDVAGLRNDVDDLCDEISILGGSSDPDIIDICG